MSKEENKALVRRYFEEFLNEGNLSIADQVLARIRNIYVHLRNIFK